MIERKNSVPYFRQGIPIAAQQWRTLGLKDSSALVSDQQLPPDLFFRHLALALNEKPHAAAATVYASHLNLFALLLNVYRYMIETLAADNECAVLELALRRNGYDPTGDAVVLSLCRFVELFPPVGVDNDATTAAEWLQGGHPQRRKALREMLLLHTVLENPAVESFRTLFDDQELSLTSAYKTIATSTHESLSESPFVILLGRSLGEALRSPVNYAPDSLADQIRFVRHTWGAVLPPEMLTEIAQALDFLLEEERLPGRNEEQRPLQETIFRVSGKHPRTMRTLPSTRKSNDQNRSIQL